MALGVWRHGGEGRAKCVAFPERGTEWAGGLGVFCCVRGVKEKVALFLQLERSSGAPPAPVPLYIRYCSSVPASKTARV